MVTKQEFSSSVPEKIKRVAYDSSSANDKGDFEEVDAWLDRLRRRGAPTRCSAAGG